MKPIPMYQHEVRAILDNRQTTVRRVVVNWQNVLNSRIGYDCHLPEHNYRLFLDNDGVACTSCGWGVESRTGKTPVKPSYYKGDILWVRETWAEVTSLADPFHSRGNAFAAGIDSLFYYRADKRKLPTGFVWRPSIHMPYDAARLFLRVKDVWVERLQEITDNDAQNEGCVGCVPVYSATFLEGRSPKEDFRALWDTLNAKRGYGWNQNPWVWVYTFEKCGKP